jgi:hypothetical protein
MRRLLGGRRLVILRGICSRGILRGIAGVHLALGVLNRLLKGSRRGASSILTLVSQRRKSRALSRKGIVDLSAVVGVGSLGAAGSLACSDRSGGISLSLAVRLLALTERLLLKLLAFSPFLADFLELFGGALGAMRLHRDMGVQVVERAVRFFAAVESALVHALNLLVTPPRPLMLR